MKRSRPQRHAPRSHARGHAVTRLGFTLAATALAGCARGPTGHQIVANGQVVAGGATQTVTVACPPGKKVLGGGFAC